MRKKTLTLQANQGEANYRLISGEIDGPVRGEDLTLFAIKGYENEISFKGCPPILSRDELAVAIPLFESIHHGWPKSGETTIHNYAEGQRVNAEVLMIKKHGEIMGIYKNLTETSRLTGAGLVRDLEKALTSFLLESK